MGGQIRDIMDATYLDTIRTRTQNLTLAAGSRSASPLGDPYKDRYGMANTDLKIIARLQIHIGRFASLWFF